MPMWLNTRGKATLGIGVCDRCHLKMPLADMVPDPNTPGVRAHAHCVDVFDPYRLPARITENIALAFPRPDFNIAAVAVVIGLPTGTPTDPWPWPGPPYVPPYKDVPVKQV
jgi:hypothetical protein